MEYIMYESKATQYIKETFVNWEINYITHISIYMCMVNVIRNEHYGLFLAKKKLPESRRICFLSVKRGNFIHYK